LLIQVLVVPPDDVLVRITQGLIEPLSDEILPLSNVLLLKNQAVVYIRSIKLIAKDHTNAKL
jgi:hypothetical protein